MPRDSSPPSPLWLFLTEARVRLLDSVLHEEGEPLAERTKVQEELVETQATLREVTAQEGH